MRRIVAAEGARDLNCDILIYSPPHLIAKLRLSWTGKTCSPPLTSARIQIAPFGKANLCEEHLRWKFELQHVRRATSSALRSIRADKPGHHYDRPRHGQTTRVRLCGD